MRGLRDRVDGAPRRLIAVDASSSSLAYAVVEVGEGIEVLSHGKVFFGGSTPNERIRNAVTVSYELFLELSKTAKYVVLEDVVFINSPQTLATLAKTWGAIVGGATLAGMSGVYKVSPIAWQSYIGTRLLTKDEKDELKELYPGRKTSWYKNKERAIRKQKTIGTINNRFGLDISDDDIADACGVAIFSGENWGKVVQYGKK